MQQLTLRGFDDELEKSIRSEAKRRNLSLNQVVIDALRKAFGLTEKTRGYGQIGRSLDHLAGRMTAENAEEVLDGIAHLEQIDESLWK